MASKDFGVIESDYAFFTSHSTEADRDLEACASELSNLGPRNQLLRVLDFGCGAGEFTSRLLKLLSRPPQQLHIALVEPVAHQRQQAAERLGSFTSHQIPHTDVLPESFDKPFDLIVSHHVLYYVDDLPGTLARLQDSLAPGGMMMLTMAPWRNFLMQLWQVGYAQLGKPVPHNAAEEVTAALEVLGIPHNDQTVAYDISFADSTENRRKILRFLFGELLPKFGEEHLLGEFDRYIHDGEFKVTTECQHLVVRQS